MIATADGTTRQTGLTIAPADLRVSKNGGAHGNCAAAGNASHAEFARYFKTLAAGDTDTLGRLNLSVNLVGSFQWQIEYQVVPLDVYNSVVGDAFEALMFGVLRRANAQSIGSVTTKTVRIDAAASVPDNAWNGAVMAVKGDSVPYWQGSTSKAPRATTSLLRTNTPWRRARTRSSVCSSRRQAISGPCPRSWPSSTE